MRLRIRAAEHGRSAEAEHREILRAVLTGAEPTAIRRQTVERLAEFRRRTAGRGTSYSAALLADTRDARLQSLVGTEP